MSMQHRDRDRLDETKVVGDSLVTVTPVPDVSALVPRNLRRRVRTSISELLGRCAGSTEQAPAPHLQAPAISCSGTVRLTISREPGRAEIGAEPSGADQHWHLAMSIELDGVRVPAPAGELAVWIALGWPELAGIGTVQMFEFTAIRAARHALVPLLSRPRLTLFR